MQGQTSLKKEIHLLIRILYSRMYPANSGIWFFQHVGISSNNEPHYNGNEGKYVVTPIHLPVPKAFDRTALKIKTLFTLSFWKLLLKARDLMYQRPAHPIKSLLFLQREKIFSMSNFVKELFADVGD